MYIYIYSVYAHTLIDKHSMMLKYIFRNHETLSARGSSRQRYRRPRFCVVLCTQRLAVGHLIQADLLSV
jgi:hypothetical protein